MNKTEETKELREQRDKLIAGIRSFEGVILFMVLPPKLLDAFEELEGICTEIAATERERK